MSTHKLVAVVGISLVAGILAPAPSQAGGPSSQVSGPATAAGTSCILNQYKVTSVKPYRLQRNAAGHLAVSETRGAEVNIEAQPGLTAEWLWLSLNQHIAAMQGSARMGDCALDIDKTQVEVLSGGPGFTVRLTAPDENSGKEVLRRAQLLVK